MLEVLLILCMIYTLIRFISLKKQIKKIEKQVSDKERINITLNDKDLERLAEVINTTLKVQKQLEIDIMNREEKLKHNICSISHDLRTPLSAIRGYLTLLKDCTEEEREIYLSIIDKKSIELNGLVQVYYELSIYEDCNFTVELEEVDLVQIVTDAVVSNYALIRNLGISIENNLPNKSVNVQGELTICARIVQNLLSNAIKYSVGNITLNIIEQDDIIIFSIKNKVNDLTQEDLDKMFERFYTKDKSRNKSGTGLGLYIVKKLVEKINGKIYLVGINENVLDISLQFKKYLNQE